MTHWKFKPSCLDLNLPTRMIWIHSRHIHSASGATSKLYFPLTFLSQCPLLHLRRTLSPTETQISGGARLVSQPDFPPEPDGRHPGASLPQPRTQQHQHHQVWSHLIIESSLYGIKSNNEPSSSHNNLNQEQRVCQPDPLNKTQLERWELFLRDWFILSQKLCFFSPQFLWLYRSTMWSWCKQRCGGWCWKLSLLLHIWQI